MRTTASSASREAKDHPMSIVRRCQPCVDQNRSTATGIDHGVPPAEPAAEGGPGAVVVDHERRTATAYDPVQLAQPGLGAGAEEVGPARVHHVDRRVRHRQRLGHPLEHGDVLQPLRTPPREGHHRRMGLDPDDALRGSRPQGQVEAGAAADVEQRATGPVADLLHRGRDQAVRVGGPVLELVELGGVPDVGGGPGLHPSIRCARGRGGSGAGRRRCRGCRWGRPTRPSRPRAAPRRSRRATR